jgi:hypothetical protein
MKTPNKIFEQLLYLKGISKKAFSKYSGISYNTVAGWKKSGFVPSYAMVLLRQMPKPRTTVSANELIAAGLPRAILWNNQSDRQIPVDLFIVSILQRAYNDFVIDKLAEFFGEETLLAALLKHKEHISDQMVQSIIFHLQRLPQTA